jgi:hypothetical protein
VLERARSIAPGIGVAVRTSARRLERGARIGSDGSRQRGAAILLAVVAMSIIFLALIAGLIVVEASAKSISNQLKYQGQSFNVASAGVTDALVWFQKQPTQPVAAFAPQRDLSATPPVNDTENSSIGIVRTFPVSPLGNVWGRYEVRASNVIDVSVQRGKTGAGTIWQFDSYGLLFVDRNGDSQLTWTDTNGNGVFDRGEPGEVIAMTKVRAEAQRLSLVLPGGNAALQGYTCSTINLTSGASSNRVLGSSTGIGIACRSGTGSPATTGATLTGSPKIQSTVSPYNDGVPSVFGITQAELVTLANLKASSVASLPDPLPAMSLVVVQGDATFTNAHPLVGSGILVVFGNLVISAGSNFNGVIYVTGTCSQSGPSQILGSVVSHGGIALAGGSDITEVDWDPIIVQQVRSALGGYRFTRTEYVIP